MSQFFMRTRCKSCGHLGSFLPTDPQTEEAKAAHSESFPGYDRVYVSEAIACGNCDPKLAEVAATFSPHASGV